MELKLFSNNVKTNFFCSSNRTFMELKFVRTLKLARLAKRSNRTFMELK